MIKVGVTGKLVRGHVLDCGLRGVEEACKRYDNQLYIKWNPKRRSGMGSWELRRRPNTKSVIDSVTFEGNTYSRVEYKELDIENHVMDIEVLDYSLVAKLHKIDTWKDGKHGAEWVNQLDYHEGTYLNKVEAKAEEEKAYQIKQNKRAIREFREFVLSGGNPYRIADYWQKK